MLLIGTVGAIGIAVMHNLAPQTPLISRIMPGLLGLLFGLQYLWLRGRPERLVPAARLGLWGGTVALALPAWLFTLTAEARYGFRLVDTLPPVVPMVFALMVAAIAFLPRHEGRWLALIAWLLTALPILGYLALHPGELLSSTGMQLAVALGPASLIVLMLIPLFRGIDQKVASLEDEKARMQQLAERDPLTGLYNRRAGEIWLHDAIQRRQPGVGLILFDIDRFKQINDRFGHALGDKVLREVSRRCSGALRRDDVLMRWGGEEFLVLLRGIDRESIVQVAEHMREACRQHPVDEVGIVTASFGCALWHPDEPIGRTLERADSAMYAAKGGGRDRVVVG